MRFRAADYLDDDSRRNACAYCLERETILGPEDVRLLRERIRASSWIDRLTAILKCGTRNP